jgi:hypothetical protein
MAIRLALALPHTPWVPERVKTFATLCEMLEVAPERQACPHVFDVRVFDQQAPNYAWTGDMWRWGIERADAGATHFIQIQDDIEVCPRFWEVLDALISAHRNSVIGLHSPVGITPPSASIYATSDGLIGTAYVVPVPILKDFLAWRAELNPETLMGLAPSGLGEDTLLGLFCYDKRIPIIHPKPSFIRHNVSIPSTYANDNHKGRRPAWPVAFDDTDSLEAMTKVGLWAVTPPAPERYYTQTHEHLLGLRDEFDKKRFFAGAVELKMQMAAKAVVGTTTAKPQIVIATPTRDGMVTESYMHTVIHLVHWPEISVMQASTYDDDIDRARSRVVRRFLEGPGTHLLFIDADVSFGPEVAAGMLRACLLGGHDYVAAAYPKREFKWERMARVAERTAENLEAAAYNFPIRLIEGTKLGKLDEWGCVSVAGVGLGATMLTRKMLEQMTRVYGPPCDDNLHTKSGDLTFLDQSDGKPTVCLFHRAFGMQISPNDPDLPSEDYAFGLRWRKLGGRVMLYLGPGAPASHAGMHVYRGQPGAFNIR